MQVFVVANIHGLLYTAKQTTSMGEGGKVGDNGRSHPPKSACALNVFIQVYTAYIVRSGLCKGLSYISAFSRCFPVSKVPARAAHRSSSHPPTKLARETIHRVTDNSHVRQLCSCLRACETWHHRSTAIRCLCPLLFAYLTNQ